MRLVAVFWVISLIVVSPQLAIQRLEPLIAFQKVSGSDRPRLRIVQSCAEFFPDHRINVAYTMFTYCVVYVAPVAVMLTAYALIARELARRYRHQRARLTVFILVFHYQIRRKKHAYLVKSI